MSHEAHFSAGYTAFTPSMLDYDLKGAPPSWARVPAMRHALSKFPHSTYFWYLDHTALIMNPELSIEGHIMNAKRLEGLMQRDKPIVPPDSVIKTFSHLKGQNVDIVLTQDKEGLAGGSFIVRRGDWAKFFLDTWFDPLYRSYNFQKAETHALVSFPYSDSSSSVLIKLS
jgi:mannan polymerase II complex MNN11 subunit